MSENAKVKALVEQFYQKFSPGHSDAGKYNVSGDFRNVTDLLYRSLEEPIDTSKWDGDDLMGFVMKAFEDGSDISKTEFFVAVIADPRFSSFTDEEKCEIYKEIDFNMGNQNVDSSLDIFMNPGAGIEAANDLTYG